uniref:Uncharacterized protein n=1 Tax=Lotharella oceanica TaxID=641309 RepID=A0A7S2U166_9EUKA
MPASPAAAENSEKKGGGVSVLTIAVFVLLLAIGRNAYKARNDRHRYAHHHKQWLPLSNEELKMWQFTPLKTRSKVSAVMGQIPPGSAAEEPPAAQGDAAAAGGGAAGGGTTKKATKEVDKGVQVGWKISCDGLPCQELLPGGLGTGGILSFEGTFGSCFDLMLGDDNFHVSSGGISGQILLVAIRGPEYILMNTHGTGWEHEEPYNGPAFVEGSKFQMDLKFLKDEDTGIELVIEVGGKQLMRRFLSQYVVNAFKKIDIRPGNFQNCAGSPSTFTRIEYLGRR